jgi:hypothetical protein
MEFLFQTLEAFGVLVDRSDIFLEDDLLSGCGIDHFREPPEGDRASSDLARVADVMAKEECLELKLGGLQILCGIFTRAAEVANGFVLHCRDIDWGEIA